jgi:hypothetical protein
MRLVGWVASGGVLGVLAGEFAPSFGSIVFMVLGDSAPAWIFFDTSLADIASSPFSPYRNGLAIKYAVGGMLIGALIHFLMSNRRLEKRLTGSVPKKPEEGAEDEKVVQARRKFGGRKTPVTTPELREAFGWDWETATAVSCAMLRGAASSRKGLPSASVGEPEKGVSPGPYLIAIGIAGIVALWILFLGNNRSQGAHSADPAQGSYGNQLITAREIRSKSKKMQIGMTKAEVMQLVGIPEAVKPYRENRVENYDFEKVFIWYYGISDLKEPGRSGAGYVFAEGTAALRLDFDMHGRVQDLHFGPLVGFMGIPAERMPAMQDRVNPAHIRLMERKIE